jgi:hypothetical protein
MQHPQKDTTTNWNTWNETIKYKQCRKK